MCNHGEVFLRTDADRQTDGKTDRRRSRNSSLDMLIFADILDPTRVHEVGPFMPSSSVFIQLMLCSL